MKILVHVTAAAINATAVATWLLMPKSRHIIVLIQIIVRCQHVVMAAEISLVAVPLLAR